MRKLFVILENGFTIDFINHISNNENLIKEKIDVQNLFRFGDTIDVPWDKKPGFLSFKHCPALWTLGARVNNTRQECTELIEEIITCANMFFDFVKDDEQKEHRQKMLTSRDQPIYLKAYCELVVYLKRLFSCYNGYISDDELKKFVNNSEWGWLKFLKNIDKGDYEKIVFVTYNYDIWLERILKQLGYNYNMTGFDDLSTSNIDIIKPHGSISFVPKDNESLYEISYKLDLEETSIDNLRVDYEQLLEYSRGAIIPPAGDSMRFVTEEWSGKLREKAYKAAQTIEKDDNVVMCGISYWHVDRRELDRLLINVNSEVNFTFINPDPPRDLNAVLISIFKNYTYQSSSRMLGEILNG